MLIEYNPQETGPVKGSLIETSNLMGKITGNIAKGALIPPLMPLGIPTTARRLGRFYERRIKENNNWYTILNCFGYVYKNFLPLAEKATGLAITGTLLYGYWPEIESCIKTHPSLLAIPIITNTLNAGYERYRKKHQGAKVKDW